MKLLDDLKILIEQLEQGIKIGLPEEQAELEIIKELYKYKKGDLWPLFLMVDGLAKAEAKKEKNLYYMAIQDMLGLNGSLARDILEFNTSKEAKELAKHTFEDNGFPLIINACKAYFPDGKSGGAAAATKWVLDKLKYHLKNHASEYEKGGKSYDWAVNNNHLKYIQLLIEND